jgi:hypothetical protein
MPRKEDEAKPLYAEGKMSDETRRQVFRKSEEEAEEAGGPAEKPGEELQYSGASESGSAKALQHGDGTHRRAGKGH